MAKTNHPYVLCQYRVDIVKKVPTWAEDYVRVGDEVYRTSHNTVEVKRTGGLLKLGESYTKFSHYE